MVAFGHTAVGGIIGATSYHIFQHTDPVTGLLLTGTIGVISHYLADLLPHGHFFTEGEYAKKVKYVIFTDLLFSILIFLATAYLSSNYNILFTLFVLFGIGGSQLPDVIDGLIYTNFLPNKGLLKWENTLHNNTHWHGKKEKTLIWSKWDIWQIAVFILGLIIVIKQ